MCLCVTITNCPVEISDSRRSHFRGKSYCRAAAGAFDRAFTFCLRPPLLQFREGWRSTSSCLADTGRSHVPLLDFSVPRRRTTEPRPRPCELRQTPDTVRYRIQHDRSGQWRHQGDVCVARNDWSISPRPSAAEVERLSPDLVLRYRQLSPSVSPPRSDRRSPCPFPSLFPHLWW